MSDDREMTTTIGNRGREEERMEMVDGGTSNMEDEEEGESCEEREKLTEER